MSTKENKILSSNDITKLENERLSEWAIKHEFEESTTDKSKIEETHRTKIRRDRDRILYSGGFRRLQDKTQVLAAVKHGDHRTRLTHTLEVEQIAVSIADALSLNKDLVSAIALGHDVGHTPFGHAVERKLDSKLSKEGGFSHAVQSVRYLQNQAFNGKGAHLTDEVLEGILMHDTDVYSESYNKKELGLKELDCKKLDPNKPPSLEAQIVYWSDKIAYLTHDFEDFRDQKIMDTAIKENENLKYEIKIILTGLLEEDRCKDIIDDLSKYETRDLIRNIINKLLEGSKNNLDNLTRNLSSGYGSPQYAKEQTLERVKGNEIKYKLTEKYNVKYKEDISELFRLDKKTIGEKIENISDDIKDQQDELNKIINSLNTLKDPKFKKEKMLSINKEYIEQKKIVNSLEKEKDLLLEIQNEYMCKSEEEKKEVIAELINKRKKSIRKKSYQDGLIINFPDDYREKYLKMRKMLDRHYIGSPTVKRSDAKAERIVEFLFKEFTENTKVLPLNIQKHIKNDGSNKKRVVADYIASMTDYYASETYMNFNTMSKEYIY